MGLFKSKRERAESKAYKKIVKKKTTLAARQSYADEAVKVASERARAKARRPSAWSTIGRTVSKGVKKVASGKPVARNRKAAKKYVRVMRKKVSKRKYTPTRRKAPVRKAPGQSSPASLNQAIYGGY